MFQRHSLHSCCIDLIRTICFVRSHHRLEFGDLLSAMDLGGLDGLIGEEPGATPGAGQARASIAKRRKLRHYDLLPAQVLNPMGVSGVETVDLGRLWENMCAGNKAAEAFSELCFQEPERRGVALSRLAEVMVTTIKRFTESEHFELIMKADIYQAAKAEALELLPHFQALCAGRGSVDLRSGSIRSVAYYRPTAAPSDLGESSDKVFDWLSKTSSPFRSVVALLSSGGLFYVAYCHEKGARAWLKSGIDQEAMRAATSARRPADGEASDRDLQGLSVGR